MRQKLALTIALAGFAVATALGVGMAGADPSAGLGDSQATQGIVTAPTLPSAQAPACANGADDDGDGQVDLEDADCESASDVSEETQASTPAESQAPGVSPESNDKVHSGAALDASEAAGASSGGVQRNQGLGSSNAASGGGVSAPSATAGDQPQSEGTDGGSQFGSGGAPTDVNPTAT